MKNLREAVKEEWAKYLEDYLSQIRYRVEDIDCSYLSKQLMEIADNEIIANSERVHEMELEESYRSMEKQCQ